MKKRPRTADLVEAFVTSRRALNGSDKYVESIRYHLGPLIRAHPTLPNNPAHLDTILAARAHLSEATRRGTMNVLRIFYRWARERYGVPDTMKKIPKPQRSKKKTRTTVTQLQIDHIFFANQGREARRDIALIRLLLDTGLRIGEVHGLTWRDMWTEEAEPGSIYYYVRVDGKSGEGSVPISPATHRALRALSHQEHIWIGRTGQPMTTNGMQKAVRRALRRAGIDGGPHMLRHTFGKMFLRAGGNLVALQLLLRHANIKTTRIYAEPDAHDVKDQHKKFSPMADRPDGLQLRLLSEGGTS